MKRTVIIALVALVFLFTACGNGTDKARTLYETDTLKIERKGAITKVYDLDGGGEYSFTTRRTRKTKAEAEPTKTTTSTDTVEIKTAYNLIFVTTKKDGTTICIR